MRSQWMLGVVVLGLLSCKKPPPAPSEYEYRLFVEGSADIVKGVEMAGTPLESPRREASGTSYAVKVSSSEYASSRSFMVLLATSCGTEKIPATLALGIARATGTAAEDRERAETQPGTAVLGELQYAAPKRARIHLDADGADGAKVEIGTTALSATSSEQDIAIGSCPSAKEVKVDGKVEGTVVVEPRTIEGTSGKKFEVPGTTLIDPSGKHCYEAVLHVYAAKDQDTSNLARSTPKRLEGSKVYAQEIDDFLKPAPEEVKSADDYPMRTEIRRCATKGAKRR